MKDYMKIINTMQYAKMNNIDPSNPETWDDNYKKRQMELAGIIENLEKELTLIKEGIRKGKINFNKKHDK